MSEIPEQLNFNGPFSGQLAFGNNNIQVLGDGNKVTVYPPGHVPMWERKSEPLTVKIKPPSLFLDRVTELQTVEESIQASKSVNLSGMAGIGKSTLIWRIAHSIRPEQFPDGIFYLSANQLKMEDMLQSLFSGFYKSNVPARPDRAQLQEALQEIKALVVIDDLNLNQDEIEVVTNTAPNCLFVVASTLQILRGSSRVVRLGGLPEPDAVTLFETELGRPLEEKERQIVCEINEMLAGHPESLRWLAATSREDRLDLEQVRERLRAVSMQGFFQESVQALPERQKKILAILATVESQVLPQEHLAAMLPEEPVQPAVNDLAARRLIQTEDQTSRISESFSAALSRSWSLAQAEVEVTRHFVDWLAKTPSRQAIEQVRESLWVLMKKAARRKDWSAVISLGRALEPYFFLSGYWQAWYEILRTILEAAQSISNQKLEGWALHQLGSRSLSLGEREQAETLLKEAAKIRHSIGDQSGLQLTQHNLSMIPKVIPVTGHEAVLTTGTTSVIPVVPVAIVIATVMAAVLGLSALALTYRPRPPVQVQPANQFLRETDRSPAFEWRRVLASSSYQIQVDDNADFSSPLYDQVLQGNSNAPDLPMAQGVYYWRVRATSRFKRTGGWSETRQFTISIPPGPISLLQPLDQSVETAPDSLLFGWTAADNATSYQIQIDNDQDFSSPENGGTAEGTEYSLSNPLHQGTYSWRVRALNMYGTPGQWSEAAALVISIPPLAISLTEPADGSKVESTTTPEFKWQSGENAKNYQVQVDDNADFSSPQFDTQLPDTSFPANAALSQGEYYWHVRGFNEFGTAGDWSEPWKFILSIPPAVPSLVNPADGFMEETTTTPAFEWTSVENAANYEMQVDDNQSFDSPSFESKTSNTGMNTPEALLQGAYYWRVRALNAYDTASDWTAPWGFIISIPPVAPNLIAPSDNYKYETSTNPYFRWQEVQNADQYEIQVDDSSGFDSPEYDTTESNTSRASGAGFAQGLYYWHVRALNPYKTAGPWSARWQFIVSIPPGRPVLLRPVDGDFIQSSVTTFGWDAAGNAAYYEIQVDNNSNFGSPDYVQRTQRNVLNVDTALPQGVLYWRVRAFNPYDTPGDWSPVWRFTLSIPPAAPRLNSPERGSSLPSTTLSFSWRQVANAEKYQVQVDNDPNFTSLDYETTTADTRTPNVTFREGKYFWRVQAYNSYGTAGDWSQAWDFTASIPARAPFLLSPEDGIVLAVTSPTFEWYGVTNAIGYEIQIDNNSDFSSPEIARGTRSTRIKIDGLVPYQDGTYPFYWRVRAFNQYNAPGLWSRVWKVTLKINVIY